jgi:ornithine cyclodeaminase/alanine dehydrogenase-like protein (mu-crystallin family)
MRDCIEAVEAAFRAQADAAIPSAVLGLHAPSGGFHIKAAGLRLSRLYVAVKINANFPGNPTKGLPTIQGLVALYDGDDGRPLAVMDSIELTALRTAAATAVAARVLARPNASTVALCGCGVQGAYQVKALAVVRSLSAVRVHDRDHERARRFATDLAAEIGLPVSAAEDWPEAARSSDIVVTCTTSKVPIVGTDDIRAGSFLAAVGADNPEKNEVEPALMARSRVYVDSIAQASAIGDLHHAVAQGVLRPQDVQAEIWEVVTGRKAGRGSDGEITIFDSTGVAVQDVAAAALVYERAEAAGRGLRFELGA